MLIFYVLHCVWDDRITDYIKHLGNIIFYIICDRILAVFVADAGIIHRTFRDPPQSEFHLITERRTHDHQDLNVRRRYGSDHGTVYPRP